jgi:two-component system, chemotaxis family, protein-glutamate methylesterase/glutaminase
VAFDIIVVGTSSGGLESLQTLLSGLPKDFLLPVVMVQHRGRDFDLGLVEYLGRYSNLPVREPEDKEPVEPGVAYLAPRDYHLLLENRGFALSTASPVAFARPSIDLLFESAAEEYNAKTIGVIMTGANDDGARGLMKIKQAGGAALVEDPSTAASTQMPLAAIALSRPDWILPLSEIAPCLRRLSDLTMVQYGT